jgi:ribosomal protein S18 acetylase RimI-like enzyme
MIKLKENELYQELEIFIDGEKIGEAEIELKGKMLSRLSIFPQYQNKGYGTEIVKMLNEKYGCNVLWVNADNKRAIHTYEKNGYKIEKPTMYLMRCNK